MKLKRAAEEEAEGEGGRRSDCISGPTGRSLSMSLRPPPSEGGAGG